MSDKRVREKYFGAWPMEDPKPIKSIQKPPRGKIGGKTRAGIALFVIITLAVLAYYYMGHPLH
jgi:hypothetical protein